MRTCNLAEGQKALKDDDNSQYVDGDVSRDRFLHRVLPRLTSFISRFAPEALKWLLPHLLPHRLPPLAWGLCLLVAAIPTPATYSVITTIGSEIPFPASAMSLMLTVGQPVNALYLFQLVFELYSDSSG